MAIKKTGDIEIGGRLFNTATGNVVAGADAIKDEEKNRYQNDINSDVARHETEIHGTGGIDSRLTDVEQMEQIVIDGGEAQIATGTDFTNPDATKRAKIPTVGAIVDGLNDGVYDISKRNPTAGPNSDGKFTLDYILSNANTLIPTGWRHGGMTISFVDSSDNKYIQARCMAQNFTTDVTQWQGVDDEPTAGSDNLVKSGGVKADLQNIDILINSYKTFIETTGTQLKVGVPLAFSGDVTIRLDKIAGTNNNGYNVYPLSNGSYVTPAIKADIPFGVDEEITIPSGYEGIYIIIRGTTESEYKKFNITIASANAIIPRLAKVENDLDDAEENIGTLNESVERVSQDVTSLSKRFVAMTALYDNNACEVSIPLGGEMTQKITIEKFGVNNLAQIKTISYFKGENLIYEQSQNTDSMGPYRVHAVNNADGDDQTISFTGGCHGYNGDQTGSATASGTMKVIADGIELQESSNVLDVCDYIEIIATNRIQGWNTKKSDGSGREILEEEIHYMFRAKDKALYIDSYIKALEDIEIDLYYGMQIAFAREQVRFNGDKFTSWLIKDTSTNKYKGEFLDSVEGKNTFINQKMCMYPVGLGRFQYNKDSSHVLAKQGSTYKIYYNVICGESVVVNSTTGIILKGDYVFDFLPFYCDVINLTVGEELVDKDYYIDVEAYRNQQIKLIVSWDSTKITYPSGSSIRFYQMTSKGSGGIISGSRTYINNDTEYTINVDSTAKYLWIYDNSVAAEVPTNINAYLSK